MARIQSVNVSKARDINHRGKIVSTGIFKEPVTDRVAVRKLGVDGDQQADLTVHGGEDKAVYVYDADLYPWWEEQLGRELNPGMFGENLTVSGLDETSIHLGDRFRAGTALLEAVQPRQPCYKLGIKFDDPGIVKRFLASKRWGVYFRVIEEGHVAAGDPFEVEQLHPDAVPVSDIFRILFEAPMDTASIERILAVESLAPEWRKTFEDRLRLLQ